jgi:transposase
VGDSRSGRWATPVAGLTLAPLVSALLGDHVIAWREPVVLVELGLVEQRYRAVLEVLEGAPVTEVARRYGVTRQSVHEWLRRYASRGGLAGLADRSSRPASCPHQMPAVVEASVVAMRRAHPAWGPDRIRWQLARDGVAPVPGRSSVYRALVRHQLVDPKKRRRRRED